MEGPAPAPIATDFDDMPTPTPIRRTSVGRPSKGSQTKNAIPEKKPVGRPRKTDNPDPVQTANVPATTTSTTSPVTDPSVAANALLQEKINKVAEEKYRELLSKKAFEDQRKAMEEPEPFQTNESALRKSAPKPYRPQQQQQQKTSFDFEEITVNADTPKKAAKLAQIELFHEWWPYLQENSLKQNWTMRNSVKDMDEELNRCRKMKKKAKVLSIVKSMDSMIDSGTETFLKKMHIPANGFAQIAREQNSLWDDELKELAIEYGDSLLMGPGARYIMAKLTLLKEVIDYNKQSMSQPAVYSQEQTNKYNNL